jgi:hypothetical protein
MQTVSHTSMKAILDKKYRNGLSGALASAILLVACASGAARVASREIDGIPPTAVGGSFRSSLQVQRQGRLGIPPTAVGGSFRSNLQVHRRGLLGIPPTAVGGSFRSSLQAHRVVVAGTPQNAPPPRDVLGFEPGEDRKLADWTQIVDYFRRLGGSSGRVQVQEAGLTTEGRPFVVAFISSEDNIKNLSRIRDAQRKLADPRLVTSAAEREHLLRETPAVVAITCSIHSTEIMASQMSMSLAFKLASDTSESTSNILRNTVLLLVPSVNPDGIDIVTNWYRKTLGTAFEGSSPPVLYHHYTGHDDNRDWFMLTQLETQILSRLLWREWYPEIVYDIHQQGQYGSRICVPPFFDPANPNIDPVIIREVGAIGMKMAVNLTADGFEGVVTNSTYDTWWHGGLRTAPYYHNQVGILTEAASSRIASPLEVTRQQLREPTRGLANPLVTSTNYPLAWHGGVWHPKDIVNMELVTARTALEEAAVGRADLIRNFFNIATRAIEAGKHEAPYAYIVPAQQHDGPTAARLIDILIQQGVEVRRAKSDFKVGGKDFKTGSYVILLAQPFRADVKCLFEAQKYPDRRLYPGGPAEPPYDVAGWTLPMQMGVDYVEAAGRFEVDSIAVESADAAVPAVKLGADRHAGAGVRFLASSNTNNSFMLINKLFRERGDLSVSRTLVPVTVSGQRYPAGAFVITLKPEAAASSRVYQDRIETLSKVAATLGVELLDLGNDLAQSGSSARVASLKKPKVGLYKSWAPSMDEGWTRWVLEQFGFDYSNITDQDVRPAQAARILREKFDVIILPDQTDEQLVAGNRPGSYPVEMTGGIGEDGARNLNSFAEQGGVLICLDSATELALKRFDLPVKNVLEGLGRDKFYAPGSIFRAVVDTSHPIGLGMPSEADLFFSSGTRRPAQPITSPEQPGQVSGDSEASRSAASRAARSNDASSSETARSPAPIVRAFAFEVTDSRRALSIARYIEGNPLRSGWLLGPEYVAGKSALVDVRLGKGRVVLFGFRTQHRAQTWGTFKFLFNSIMLGAER